MNLINIVWHIRMFDFSHIRNSFLSSTSCNAIYCFGSVESSAVLQCINLYCSPRSLLPKLASASMLPHSHCESCRRRRRFCLQLLRRIQLSFHWPLNEVITISTPSSVVYTSWIQAWPLLNLYHIKKKSQKLNSRNNLDRRVTLIIMDVQTSVKRP